jgi:hypothetical protein
MAERLIRDNTQYTTKLTGSWVSDKISPLQLIHDYEGRIYSFLSGTWNDRMNNWGAEFIEFKAIQPDPGVPPPGDTYRLTVGKYHKGDEWDDEYGFFDEFAIGGINPDRYETEPVYKLATISANSMEFALGIPVQSTLPGVDRIKIHFINLGATMDLYAVGNTYKGTLPGIRKYLSALVGTDVEITIEK